MNNKTLVRFLMLAIALLGASGFAEEDGGWIDLGSQVDPLRDTVAGSWHKNGSSLTTTAERSSRITLPYQPKSEYDFRVRFTRNSGVHSIALMFVMGSGQATFEIDDVDPSRYDAIMFSGGWGASMYQYAFPGSYVQQHYNGDRRTKTTVNRLLNEFVAQDKYVGALCHGVSVLAWARVNGKSILAGKRSVGSPRQSPAGIYNGRRGQPLSRWNAEVNGAKLSPARSLGNPQNSVDDVVVDGKIITGEDDDSARTFGATLAKLLTATSR